MSCFLHINTATEQACVCLSEDENILGYKECLDQKVHSSFLQPAIRELLISVGRDITDLEAVSVINGPGSYTGLRVGLSAAKGICFALGIPLLCISTLEWLAHPFKENEYDLIIPMIDARRMEVFTAGFDRQLGVAFEPKALILNEQSFEDILQDNKIMFTGSGAHKLPESIKSKSGCFVTHTLSTCSSQASIAVRLFMERRFSELAYTEPFYLKPFHSPFTNRI
jgi:tRNA threonylcarbamoyladenosine biosynthesis protein TsaB